MDNSTICAVSTAVGTGAISIVRCSGVDAIKIVNSIFKGKDLEKVDSHTISYGHIVFNGEVIDEVLVSVMRAPKTFTCEDVVEINVHGGITTTDRVLELLLNNGCRLAEPGEFTKRAFLNGRIDLTQAEGVEDIIEAESEKARKLAINQISGKLTPKIDGIRKKLLALQAEIEVNIDFPEYEEAEEYTESTIRPKLEKISAELDELVRNSNNGKMIKNGINIALIGKPNAGKSSILNGLLEENKAIVTNIPGTTRDVIEGKVILDGIVLNFIDTAGIRETDDVVEKIGVQKSLESAENADLRIYVLDNSEKLDNDTLEFIKSLKDKKLVFVNKNDLDSSNNYDGIDKDILVYGNTIESDGLESLKNKITQLFKINELETSDYSFLSNARQISLVKQALESINSAVNNTYTGVPIDMYTIDIKDAYDLLGKVIGKTYDDDLLDELFSRFCLGK